MAIWRLPKALDETGKTRSPFYNDIALGLMTKPVRIGTRAVGWPADEIQAINAARIAGKPADELRALVAKLHAARDGLQ